MIQGVADLRALLSAECDQEAEYQELLSRHPWMFGGMYSSVDRHTALDDRSIPDFTARRCYDKCLDIIELKQPFLKCFRDSGGFASGFNDAWNQAERYVDFVQRQRSYLREERGLCFENPRCFLMMGYKWTDDQMVEIRRKTGLSGAIEILTFDQLLEIADHVVGLVRSAGQRVARGVTG